MIHNTFTFRFQLKIQFEMDPISMFQKQIIRIGNAKNYIDNIVDGIYVGDRFQT